MNEKFKTRSWIIVFYTMLILPLSIIAQIILKGFAQIPVDTIATGTFIILGAYIGIKQPADSLRDGKLKIDRTEKNES